MDLKEKLGGSRKITQVQKDFLNFIESNNQLDVKTSNGIYTWNNRRKGFTNIAERLDRYLVSEDWLQENLIAKSTIHPVAISDHFPITLTINEDSKPAKRQFRFEKMWLRAHDLPDLMKH